MDLEKYKKSYQEIEKLQQTKNLDYYRHPARYYVKPFKIVETSTLIISPSSRMSNSLGIP